MPIFTKNLKLKAFGDVRVGRYLFYALGEIVLVVAGILIALQINNHNEEVKQADLLNGVLKNVRYDLELDTLTVSRAIEFYEAREKVATAIIDGKYGPETFRKCALCGSLVSTYAPLKINDKGYSQLKSFYDSSENRDTLVVEIVQFYNAFNALLDEFGDQVKDFTIDNIKEWRDEQPWFASVMNGVADPRFYEYMESQDYKNKVAYFNVIACKNYLNMLRQYKLNAVEILSRLQARDRQAG